MPAPDPRPSRRPIPVPHPRPVAHYAPLALAPKLRAELTPIPGSAKTALAGRVYQITNWERWPMDKRIAYLHALTADWAKDPAIMALATSILRDAGVVAREYREQWAALLSWVQTKLLYVNEPGERICSPQHTLSVGAGDCDDLAIVLGALGESLRLPWAFTISGTNQKGEKVRWVEGSGPVPPGVTWAHIYLATGWPPFNPTSWVFAEPTMRVPLGWDCVSAPRDRSGRLRLPEMGALGGAAWSGAGFGIPSGHHATRQDLPPMKRLPGMAGAGFAGVPDASTGYGKGDPRRYTGVRGGTTGRPGATIGLNTGTGQSWPGTTRPTFGTADLAGAPGGALFGGVVATVSEAAKVEAKPSVSAAPRSKARDFAASIPWANVAAITLAGIASFAVTQGIIAPRLGRARR